ncbi:hypothetical protein Aph02nite_50530 [Actinoplanes philippinensis]|uniref:DUF4190 domain-containing protein n=1 Tax=Actinoplanes philippinensis TaxID=35752 RepID=A0A1I2ITV6_9ACTN|nr:hypothetical protein [Actinoplanes philippinensis]GIE79103.1 hypothetical protein Aph02nite_50530 [Actinoplanes philippinensis]SFF44206.1 hypothetical protein SAMN05421541_110306 [Actinoplanes philippinensis]
MTQPPGPPYQPSFGPPPTPYSAPPSPYASPYAYVPPPPPTASWQPERVDQVTGTGFGLVHLQVAPLTSGAAIGSLVAGIGAILVSLAVFCFGLSGAEEGWGGWAAGAFVLLSVMACAGAVSLGVFGRRQIRRSPEPGRIRFTGRGLSTAGIVCGITGAALSLVALGLGLALQLS